jgi:hypothetical protein
MGMPSCHSKIEPTIAVKLASGHVKLQIPQSWSSHKVMPVFPPDCASCSGSEHNEFFGEKAGDGIVVIVMVFPQGISRFLSSKDEVSIIKEKCPDCVIGDTISEIRKGYRFSSVAYKQGNSASQYHVSTKWSGSYRTVVAHFGGKDTNDFRETVAEIQKSVHINPAFLNAAKL